MHFRCTVQMRRAPCGVSPPREENRLHRFSYPSYINSKRSQPIMDRDVAPYDHSPSEYTCLQTEGLWTISWELSSDSPERKQVFGPREAGNQETDLRRFPRLQVLRALVLPARAGPGHRARRHSSLIHIFQKTKGKVVVGRIRKCRTLGVVTEPSGARGEASPDTGKGRTYARCFPPSDRSPPGPACLSSSGKPTHPVSSPLLRSFVS